MADTIKSTSDTTKHGQIILNPDGTNVGASTADGGAFAAGTTPGNLTMGVYESTPSTVTTGKAAVIAIDNQRNTKVVEQYAPGYEDNVNNIAKVNQVFTPTYISTATTTVIKTSAGLLHTLVVNGGTTGTIIVYDNTAASGTIIASFDTTNALATYTFNATFATGLTVVTSAATKLTVTWR